MSRWIAKIEDVDDITHSGGALIVKAGKLCKDRLGKNITKSLKDNVGIMGWLTYDSIVVAKKYVYGWIVSCHKGVVELAQEKDLSLLMYIEKSDTFYQFDPDEIIKQNTINYRGKIPMMNFDVRLGKNIEKNEEETKKDVNVQKGLSDY